MAVAVTQIRWGGKWVHLTQFSPLSAKNYQNWWKFDKVLTKTILHSFLSHGVCLVIIIRPHHSTTYIDAAYCCRGSSMVCQSVCLSQPWALQKWLNRWRFCLAYVLDGGAYWRHLANTTSCPHADECGPFVKLLWPLVIIIIMSVCFLFLYLYSVCCCML